MRIKNKKYLGIKFIVLFMLMLLIIGIVMFWESHNFSKEEIRKQLEENLTSANAMEKVENSESAIAELIYKNMTYNIVKVEDFNCTISVTAPDMRTLFFSVFDLTSYETATNMDVYENTVNFLLAEIEEKLLKGDYKNITTVVQVPVNSDGNIEITYELTDALYGGLLTLQQELLDNYENFH